MSYYEKGFKNITFLIQMGADVDFVDNDGNTPLFKAALHSRETQMKELLDNGANANFKNDRNMTALAIVSKTNYLIDYCKSSIRSQPCMILDPELY